MLTGRTPFQGDTSVAVAYRRLEADVPAPSEAGDDVSDELDAFVLGATCRDREERWGDARAMLAELDRAAAAGGFPPYTVPAPRRSSWTRARQEAARSAAPGDESEFEAAVRESGEALRRRDDGLPPGATRVQPRAGVTAVQAGPPPAPAYAPEPADRQRSPAVRPRRGTGWIWLLLVAVVALALGVAGWWLGSGRFATVPSVAGMSAGQAVDAVNGVGLVAQTRDAYSDDVPVAGLVGTEPAAGSRVPRGDRVDVLVSAGRPVVPEIGAARDVDTVSGLISERSLQPVRGPTEYSDSVPVGQVARLDPRPGTQVAVGARVSMLVSRGPAPVAVPDVTGLPEDQARSALVAAGLRVDRVDRVFDSSAAGGRTLGTTPARGAQVTRGSAVTLRVNSALEVPDVTGLPTDEAARRLGEAGLRVVTEDPVTDKTVPDGHVVRTSPAAGTRVDPADPVVRLTPSDAVRVPGVLGMRASEAVSTLRSAGLDPRIDTGTSGGLVYGQSPLPGKLVGRGERVEVDALG